MKNFSQKKGETLMTTRNNEKTTNSKSHKETMSPRSNQKSSGRDMANGRQRAPESGRKSSK